MEEEEEETEEDDSPILFFTKHDFSLLKLRGCLAMLRKNLFYVSWIQPYGIPILRSSNAAPFEAILRLLWYPYLVSDA